MATVQGRFSATREAAQLRTPSLWRAAVQQRWFIVISSAFVLLRIPSFVEPTWYSDAGTYADIGSALNRGARLYLDVWDNKPPGIYWMSALLAGHGPIAIAMPLASTLFAGTAAVCVASIARKVGGAGVGAIAALSYVVVASLPSLDGDLFNAELFGATFMAAAIAIVLYFSGPRWLIVAGALAGLALLFKGTFAADLIVVIGIAAMVATPRARNVITRSSLVVAGWSIVAAAAALALFEQGALGAAIAVVARSDVGYVATYGSQGFVGIAGAMLTAARVLIPVGAGAGVAAAFVVRRHLAAAAVAWWLGWDVASSMLSGRGFPHYVQQAEPAICVALAVAASTLWRRYGHKEMYAAATMAAAVVSCLLVLLVPPAELSLAQGGGLVGLKVDSVPISVLPAYYVDGYHRLFDPSQAPAFDRLFPANLALQRTAVNEIDSHSAPGDRVYVWGWIPWIYTLSNRTPAGRFVALDSAYYVEPSAQETLLHDLEARPPAALIVDTGTTPGALLDFLRLHHYLHVVTNNVDLWVLQDSSAGR
jgi:hypothetical protein